MLYLWARYVGGNVRGRQRDISVDGDKQTNKKKKRARISIHQMSRRLSEQVIHKAEKGSLIVFASIFPVPSQLSSSLSFV